MALASVLHYWRVNFLLKTHRGLLLFLFILSPAIFFFPTLSAAQAAPQLKLIPVPSSVQLGTGQLIIDSSFSIAVTGDDDGTVKDGIDRFVAQLSRQTGIPFKRGAGNGTSKLTIHAQHKRESTQKLSEDESYELTVSQTGAELRAPNSLGILHGLQTFLQLEQPTTAGFAVPVVTIKDAPRFAWRGLMIDVCRHFIPLDVLKRNVDGMAAVKLNVLHLHLSDHEGFRIESKKFPKLQEDGSNGSYYTQAEMREFIAYARDRGVRVLPEFDVPGHSRSWLVGYPELASGPGPYSLVSNVDPVMDPTQEATYKFLDKFIGEMAGLFPDAYFHIGGDEVDGKQWDANPKIQDFIRTHGMKNNQDLQAYFNQRLQKIVSKHHKIMIGWDEVLHPDLPKSIVVQSWRGPQSLAVAAKQGYSNLLSSGYYLDLIWPASRHYAVDPISGDAAALSPEEKSKILGGEACMWAELVTRESIDSRIWPRTGAIAERLWSPAEVQDVGSMYRRLGELSWRLELLGLTHKSAPREMLHRMLGSDDVSALRVLADVVEPVKDYTRAESIKRPADSSVPLNRLVDAVSPESDVARNFRDLVQTFIKSGYKDQESERQIRSWLTKWSENDAKLDPELEQSFLLQETEPLSADLSAVSAAGLAALDYLDKSEASPDAWRVQQMSLMTSAKTAKAEVLLMIVDPVQQLVDASAHSQMP
ncbi:MAG TPA: family 20 glycosylhydrolase [Candidatus Sulfotelmatobacter sp.]|jgi:hexosaminidase